VEGKATPGGCIASVRKFLCNGDSCEGAKYNVGSILCKLRVKNMATV